MQIGVAHAGGLQLHKGFTVAGCGQFEIGNLQRGAEFGDHCSALVWVELIGHGMVSRV